MYKMAVFKSIIFSLTFLLSNAYADFKAGPVGGLGGSRYQESLRDDERICGIYIHHAGDNVVLFGSSRIHSIQLELCDNFGNRYLSERHGSSDGIQSYFSLSANETLDSIHLTKLRVEGSARIVGIEFRTDRNRTFQYGGISPLDLVAVMGGSVFERLAIPIGHEISGIFGRANNDLDSLGILYRDASTFGFGSPAGSFGNVGDGGQVRSFTENINKNTERLCGVVVNHGRRVNAIQLEVCDEDGTAAFRTKQGGDNGNEDYFKINAGEHLVNIKGFLGRKDGVARIFGVQFVTNTGRTSPLYGNSTGDDFEFAIPDGYLITAITGAANILSSDRYRELDALGVRFQRFRSETQALETPSTTVIRNSCSEQGTIASSSAGASSTLLGFTNSSSEPVAIHWLNFSGDTSLLSGNLQPGDSIHYRTFTTHRFMVANTTGNCLGIVSNSNTSTQTVEIINK